MADPFPIPRPALEQHVLVLGKTRSGKSTALRDLVEPLLAEASPVIILDPKGDGWGLKSSADGKKPGFPVIIFGGKHQDLPLNPRAGAEIAELVATGNRPCIIDLKGWTVGDRTRFFVDFASALFKHTRGRRWLVIDECHNFAPQQGRFQDPDSSKMLHWANTLASEGSGLGLTLLSASQRPQKVHKDYVSCHETLIAKRVIHPLDRDAIKDWIDGCDDRDKGKEVLNSLAGMPRTEGWVWSPEIGFGPVRMTFPMFSTFDSFKPPEPGAAETKLKGWASVDLDEVRVKLAAVVEENKAKDPKHLQARIAELEQLLAGQQRVNRGIAPASDPAAIAAAETRGAERERKRIPAQLAELEKHIRGAVDQELGERVEAIRKILLVLGAAWKDIEAETKLIARATGRSRSGARFVEAALTLAPARPQSGVNPIRETAVSGQPVSRKAAVAPSNEIEKSYTAKSADPATGGLPVPLQKIVDAIAWWNVLGIAEPSYPQVGFRAGYSPKGGTFNRYLSELRSRALIVTRGKGASLTADGERAAAAPGAPPTGEELRSTILASIDGPLARLLTPLIEAWPERLTKADLGTRAGYEAAGGTFNRYLSSLRSLQLVTGRGPEIAAEDWMFP